MFSVLLRQWRYGVACQDPVFMLVMFVHNALPLTPFYLVADTEVLMDFHV